MHKSIVTLVVSSLFGVLVSSAVAQAKAPTLHVGDDAPPLVIAKWIKGAPETKLNDGKVRVVEFWATWCVPCKTSIPHLTKLAERYRDNATFIGVDCYEHTPKEADYFPKVEKFVSDFGPKMEYTVGIDGAAGVMSKTWLVAAGKNLIPTAFVVNQDGKIAWIGHPMMGLDDAVKHIIARDFDLKAEAEKEQKATEKAAADVILYAPMWKALSKKDYKGAVAALDSIIAGDKSLSDENAVFRFQYMAQYDEQAALAFAREIWEKPYMDASMLNTVAWAIIGDQGMKNPDTKLAVRIAEKAVKLAPDDPNVLDTLAVAYSKVHRNGDAVATEKKAVAFGSAKKDFDAKNLENMKKRLAEYEKAQ